MEMQLKIPRFNAIDEYKVVLLAHTSKNYSIYYRQAGNATLMQMLFTNSIESNNFFIGSETLIS